MGSNHWGLHAVAVVGVDVAVAVVAVVSVAAAAVAVAQLSVIHIYISKNIFCFNFNPILENIRIQYTYLGSKKKQLVLGDQNFGVMR